MRLLILFCLLFFFSSVGNVFAAGEAVHYEKQCAELLKECFARTGFERSNCLFSSSKHPFCEGTQLGALGWKRFQMSSTRPAGMESQPGIMGPQLIDQQCIAQFDNQLLASLIEGSYSESALEGFDAKLSECVSEVGSDFSRP